MTNGISQCATCGGVVFYEQNVPHVCAPSEAQLGAKMDSEKVRREAREDVVIAAHNAMIWWGNLKCDDGHVKLPIKFTIAFEELDRAVERLETLNRTKA